jgi:hypothetical protein
MNRSRQTTKGNPANVNAKRDSAKKKANKAIIINSGRLSSLQTTKVDQILGTILSKASLNVNLRINADQCIVTIVNEDDGKRVCTIADILRINGFRKFAMDQKKISEASTILDPVADRFFNAFTMICADKEMAEFMPPQIQSGPIAALKDANVITGNLLKNDEALGKMSKVNTKGDSRTLIDMMRNWISKTLEIYASLYIEICKGQDTKGFLAEELFAQKIPKWAFDKFSRTDLNKIAGQDIRRLFFPVDVRKGIFFTVHELSSEEFRSDHLWLTRFSDYQIRVINSAELVKLIAKGEAAVSFTNESDAIGTALRSEKVIITPHWFGVDFNIEPRTKKLNNFCANPDFSTPRQGLRTVLEFGLAIQTGDFRIPDMVGDFLVPLTKPTVTLDFVKNVTSKRNFFKVLHENIGKTEPCLYNLYRLSGESIHKLVNALLPLLLRISLTGPVAQALLSSTYMDLTTTDEEGNPSYLAAAMTSADSTVTIPLSEHVRFDSLTAKVETDDDRKLRAKVVSAAALPTGKQLKKTKGQKFSQLTTTAKAIVKTIEAEKSLRYLADPVGVWLQGFTSDVIQNVAASLVAAQFGSLLDDFEPDDDSSDEEATDDEDDE